jgi:hypothetical protein
LLPLFSLIITFPPINVQFVAVHCTSILLAIIVALLRFHLIIIFPFIASILVPDWIRTLFSIPILPFSATIVHPRTHHHFTMILFCACIPPYSSPEYTISNPLMKYPSKISHLSSKVFPSKGITMLPVFGQISPLYFLCKENHNFPCLSKDRYTLFLAIILVFLGSDQSIVVWPI